MWFGLMHRTYEGTLVLSVLIISFIELTKMRPAVSGRFCAPAHFDSSPSGKVSLSTVLEQPNMSRDRSLYSVSAFLSRKPVTVYTTSPA